MRLALLLVSALLISCSPRVPIPFEDTQWSTEGNPVSWQKMSGRLLETGFYRFVDTENKVVVYLFVNSVNGVTMTSQKVGK